MKHITLILLMLLATTGAAAQDRAATGVVRSADGEPLVGVAVRLRGTQQGTQTDADGRFALQCPIGSILDFTYIGFKSTVAKTGRRERVVTLEEDTKSIEQVVVTGYTQTDIRKATGSVGILTEKDLKDQPLANVDMLMQGKLAGVNVQAVSGRPGESAKVRIRGISSITGNSEPLWVVDGVPLQKNIPSLGSSYIRSGDFSTLYANGVAGIPPQNIESITVLKDAAAAAIYGSEAQAGVIVITTKRGQAGNIHVNYSGNVTLQTAPSRDHNLMDSRQKLDYEQQIWDEFSAYGFTHGGYYPRIGITGQICSGYGRFAGWSREEQDAYIGQLASSSTDWFRELMRNSVSTSHYLSASGGSDKLTYYVSAGMATNKGIIRKSASDSYNFSAKVSANPSQRVTLNFQADYSYLKSLDTNPGLDLFRYAYFANPYERPYLDDGSFASDETYFSLRQTNGQAFLLLPQNGVSIMREIDGTKLASTSSSTTLRADITWRITDHLRLYGLAAYTYAADASDSEVRQDTYAAWQDRPFENGDSKSMRIYGNMTQANTTNRNWLVRAQADYSQTFSDIHHLRATLGTEVRNSYAKTVGRKVYGYDPVTGNHSLPLFPTPASGTFTDIDLQRYHDIVNLLSEQSRVENAFASFYGAIDYVLMNRYVANVTARSDGSNNFGSKEQFNVTWSAGLAWNIDEEQFMQRIRNIVSHATIRLSTGLTGGVNRSVYPVLIMNYMREFRNDDTQAYRMASISNPPNPHLRWEHTHDWNGSIDLGFLRDRLSLNVSLYRRRGYDLVTPVRVVSTTGFDTQSYNTSEQLNQGFEIMVGATPIRTDDWRWSVNANIAYNQNVLTDYRSPRGSLFGDIYVGYPQGKLFGGKPSGIDPTTGIYTFLRRDDAAPDANPAKAETYLFYLGTTNYPWTGGASTSLSWRGLSLSVSTAFSLGAMVNNDINPPSSASAIARRTTNLFYNNRYDIYAAQNNRVSDAAYRWTPENPVTDGYPRLIDAHGESLGLQELPVMSEIHSGIYFQKCNYWKISSLTLAYSLPQHVCRRFAASSCGVSFTANNLFIITNYKGMNPETPGAVYPMSRSFSFGLNLGF